MSLFNPHMSVLEASMQVGEGEWTKAVKHPETLQKASILLSPSNRVHYHNVPVDDKIYGGFLEHLGRCIYGGLVNDPKDPSPDAVLTKGEGLKVYGEGLPFRQDVLDVIGKKGELEVPLLRWPGGEPH